MRKDKLKIWNIYFLLFIFFSFEVYASPSQEVSITLVNQTDNDFIIREKGTFYSTGGREPSDKVLPDESTVYSKNGKILGGPMIFMRYDIEDGMPLFMQLNQDNGGGHYSVVVSLMHSKYGSIIFKNESNPGNQKFSERNTYQFNGIKIIVDISSFKTNGAWSKSMKVTVSGSTCPFSPAFENVEFKEVQYDSSTEGIYAYYNECLYYSHCIHEKSDFCSYSKGNDRWKGIFYPIRRDASIVKKFKNTNKVSSILGKSSELDISKPVPHNYALNKSALPLYYIVSAVDLGKEMDAIDKQYCDLVKKNNREDDVVACADPVYFSRPQVATQLKYLGKDMRQYYECALKAKTYPNIGANICQLKSQYTINKGSIISNP